eukprot:364787-Chlamydomonas_euryale.AAC.19
MHHHCVASSVRAHGTHRAVASRKLSLLSKRLQAAAITAPAWHARLPGKATWSPARSTCADKGARVWGVISAAT